MMTPTTANRRMQLGALALLALAICAPIGASAAQRPDLHGSDNNWIPRGTGGSPRMSPQTAVTQDLNSLTPADLVAALVGTGPNAPIVSNVTYSGSLRAAGKFTSGFPEFGITDGVVLSSGSIVTLQGPNLSDNTTFDNAGAGDADLDALIPGYFTLDAAVLEFDLECPNTLNISFQYAFASEEYNEWVNSQFNDVFGFFLNGVNIAKLPPDFTVPVSINNVNCGNPFPDVLGPHCILYQNNDLSDGGGGFDTEMDGFTKVIQASAVVNPGVNHFKIAIADAGDRNLDSNVLIRGQSLLCEIPVPADPGTWGHVKAIYR